MVLAIKYGQDFLDVADADDHYHRGFASIFLAMAYWTDGNLETACQYNFSGTCSAGGGA